MLTSQQSNSINYDTKVWNIEISCCGTHSRSSHTSITKPFLVVGMNGPTKPGRVHIYSLPHDDEETLVIPLSDEDFNKELLVELSFKGLTQFQEDWSFTLMDTVHGKSRKILNQEPLMVRPRLKPKVAPVMNVLNEDVPEHKTETNTHLELHVKVGSFLRPITVSN